jgi:hypothetical protein
MHMLCTVVQVCVHLAVHCNMQHRSYSAADTMPCRAANTACSCRS